MVDQLKSGTQGQEKAFPTFPEVEAIYVFAPNYLKRSVTKNYVSDLKLIIGLASIHLCKIILKLYHTLRGVSYHASERFGVTS